MVRSQNLNPSEPTVTKKQHFLVIDSETTITDKVVDFAAVITNREGEVINSCAVLVNGIFGVDDLFYDKSAGLWGKRNLPVRMANYHQMLETGARIIASVAAINRWLDKARVTYNPELTAYNLAFDASKCKNTGIDLSGFSRRFCLWHAAASTICKTKDYRNFIAENHLFNTPTSKGNMTYRTDAEAVSGFLAGKMSDEPHTALEDIVGFEIPVLVSILRKRKWRDSLESYNWVKFQVKHHFKAR